ncbi:hypothetical protein BH09BAC3_BH09BAC3_21090 [soil metagenome]
MNSSGNISAEKSPLISEEWAAVICGLVVVGLYLSGIKIPIPSFSWSNSDELLLKVMSTTNLLAISFHFIFLIFIATLAYAASRKPILDFLRTFSIVYLLTLVALILAGNSFFKNFNLEPVIFSLVIGLLIRNLVNVPQWFRSSLSAELFVKIGLVLLGASVIFSDLLKAGMLGLIQAFIVVLSVWYFSYWVAKKFNIEDDLNFMLASAVSICGVSAAIATAGAIKGDPKKLSYVISLVLITAVPMMLLMPPLAQYLGLSQEVTGAWIGGTIDTTGAVVAAGTLAGEAALKTSTIVKFSQNVLLGLAAFAISIYWTYTKKATNEKPSIMMIWDRFPKFVVGFLLISLLFSFIIDPAVVSHVKDGIKTIQTALFTLAFMTIGLETKFSDLFFNKESKKPLYVFLIAQGFNIIITLLIAWILFN